MRLQLRLIRKNIFYTIICVSISAFALNVIPHIQNLDTILKKCTIFLIGFLFWGGIIAGVLFSKKTKGFLWIVKREYKLDFSGLPGIVNFSKEHIIIYAICSVGLVFMISDMFFDYISMYIMFPVISIVFFTFAMHCIVDGKIYKNYKIVRDGKNNGC